MIGNFSFTLAVKEDSLPALAVSPIQKQPGPIPSALHQPPHLFSEELQLVKPFFSPKFVKQKYIKRLFLDDMTQQYICRRILFSSTSASRLLFVHKGRHCPPTAKYP